MATAAGGLPETVNHEQTGLLVPVGDAEALADGIVRLLSDAPLAGRLAQAPAAFKAFLDKWRNAHLDDRPESGWEMLAWAAWQEAQAGPSFPLWGSWWQEAQSDLAVR